MNLIRIDKSICEGCAKCYTACWVDVLRWHAGYRRPVVAYPEDCVECNCCEINCPSGALTVIPDYSKPFPNVYA